MNWKFVKIVVCPEGHINVCDNGVPKFCQECGLPIDVNQKARRCKICGRPITKDLGKLGNGMREEYKDSGMCVPCWIYRHPEEVKQARIKLAEKTL